MGGKVGILRNMVRYDSTMGVDGTFLMRCDDCAKRGDSTAYWPLSKEFWLPSQGLQRCRACHRYQRRSRHRQTVEERRAKSRFYYQRNLSHRLAYARAYMVAHRDHINTLRRERYAARKAANESR